MFVIIIAVICTSPITNASVMDYGYNFRYGHLSSGKYLAKINYSSIASSLSSKQATAISHWNSSASSYVSFTNSSISNADITVSSVTSTWEPGSSIFGITCIYDNEGKWYSGGYYQTILTPQASPKPGVKRYIQFASIMLSPALTSSSSSNQDRTLRHKMGHAIALGHSTTTSDLMYPTPKYNPANGVVTNRYVGNYERNKLSADLSNY